MLRCIGAHLFINLTHLWIQRAYYYFSFIVVVTDVVVVRIFAFFNLM